MTLEPSRRAMLRVARPNSFDRAPSNVFHHSGRHAQAALGRATRLAFCLAVLVWANRVVAAGSADAALDPRGETHIPIGIANTLDSLKTFVEAQGNFSPGVGSYGVYFWLYDTAAGRRFAPTMKDVPCEHGLAAGGYLLPWAKWTAGDVEVRSELCHVVQNAPQGPVHVVGARVTLRNAGHEPRAVFLYAALRPLGPAGFDVRDLRVDDAGAALLVEGRAAIVARQNPSASGVVWTDTIGQFALRGATPEGRSAVSAEGNCSGALRFDVTLPPGGSRMFELVCPVLPGRRAVRHRWDGVSEWAQFDLAQPNPGTGGVLQPDPGLSYYRQLEVGRLFAEARDYWQNLVGRVELRLPDPRWSEAFAAITGHAAVAMNEGAPDVAVVNYNVFDRDGVYVANILQKAGRADLAAQAIDYFLAHPFNGRSYPEADNPGQILWIMGEHWRFTHDRARLERVYPAAQKLAAMIRYYRTTEGPYWVQMDALAFGDEVPVEKRRELKPGRCDGHNPAYTEAFDLAGIRAAASLARALDKNEEAGRYETFATELFSHYDRAYGSKLPDQYGSYCVLWPCRLYPLETGKAYQQFRALGPQKPQSWRYFPLARAHQSLLAGNREAGWRTLELHLDQPQMRCWYAFDEGGKSGSGGWGHLRTTWNGSVAMPHGWAIAEVHLLLRDCLAYEDDGRLVLFAGVPPSWFRERQGIGIRNLPTHFGDLGVSWETANGGATLRLEGKAQPPNGFVLSLPESLKPSVSVGGKTVESMERGYLLPADTKEAHIQFDS
jgi:hypothetical protein